MIQGYKADCEETEITESRKSIRKWSEED